MRINLESPILNFLSRAWDMVAVSVLFLLTSLPIFTIGAAMTAMHSTVMAICNDSCSGVLSKYFGAFKADFKQSTVIWLGYLVALAVLVLDAVACFSYQEADFFGSFMKGITLFFGILFILMLTYTYAVIARYVVTWKQALRNALYLISKYKLTSILLLVINVAHIFVYYMWIVLAIPVTPFLLFAQGALINRAINKEQGVVKEKKRRKSDYETYDD